MGVIVAALQDLPARIQQQIHDASDKGFSDQEIRDLAGEAKKHEVPVDMLALAIGESVGSKDPVSPLATQQAVVDRVMALVGKEAKPTDGPAPACPANRQSFGVKVTMDPRTP